MSRSLQQREYPLVADLASTRDEYRHLFIKAGIAVATIFIVL